MSRASRHRAWQCFAALMVSALLIPSYIVGSPPPFLPGIAAAIAIIARRLLGLKCEVSQ